MAQPTLVASGIENLPEFDADSSITIPVTISGTNPALVVKIGGGSASDVIDTVTYNGVTVPEIVSSGAAGASATATIFVLAAPTTGTNDLVVTVTTPFADIGIIWEVWSGVDQTSPTGVSGGGNNAFQGSPRSTAISLGADSVGIDSIAVNGASAPVLTAGGTQTQQGQYVARTAASYITAGSAMSWTWAGGSSQQVGHAVVELVGAAGSDTTPPTITGPTGAAGAATIAVNVAENTTACGTWSADEAVTWAVSGGADASAFSIGSGTGVLVFNAAPDFEAPSDVGANNVYEVIVTATDGSSNTSSQTVNVTVTDVADTPGTITMQSPSMRLGSFVSSTVSSVAPWTAGRDFVVEVHPNAATDSSGLILRTAVLTTDAEGELPDIVSLALAPGSTVKLVLWDQVSGVCVTKTGVPVT